jgi:DNA-binding transcriptional MocR family regulator
VPRRQPTREQTLVETLAQERDPDVAIWARAHRQRVRNPEDLFHALERLQAQDGPHARTLAATIWLAWRGLTVS